MVWEPWQFTLVQSERALMFTASGSLNALECTRTAAARSRVSHHLSACRISYRAQAHVRRMLFVERTASLSVQAKNFSESTSLSSPRAR